MRAWLLGTLQLQLRGGCPSLPRSEEQKTSTRYVCLLATDRLQDVHGEFANSAQHISAQTTVQKHALHRGPSKPSAAASLDLADEKLRIDARTRGSEAAKAFVTCRGDARVGGIDLSHAQRLHTLAGWCDGSHAQYRKLRRRRLI